LVWHKELATFQELEI